MSLDEILEVDREIYKEGQETLEEAPGTITYYPSHIAIAPYEEGENQDFESYLSVWDKVYFKYKYHAYLYKEETKTLYVPGGIAEVDLKTHFPSYEVRDFRPAHMEIPYPNLPIKMKSGPRDDMQRQAIAFMRENSREVFGQKFLSLSTGGGKTYCAINHVTTSRRRPIIFVPDKSLASQWEESILQFTDTTPDEIYLISGKSSIKKLLKMGKAEVKNHKFFIALHQTIGNYIGEDFDLFQDLLNHLGVSLKIFDYCPTLYKSR